MFIKIAPMASDGDGYDHFNERHASELGERLLALMNDGDPPLDDPMGWEESGVKIAARLIDGQRESMNPLMRLILVRQIGAYLGELLRRECGGQWLVDENGPFVRLANGLNLTPFRRTERHFDEGMAGDIFAFYRVSRALGSLSEEELGALARGELKLEERFPDLGGTVTLQPS